MGYKAAVQILKQAEDLKSKVQRKCDLLSDSQAWTDQQKLQNIYHQALVLDLEYALDKKVEQDLWNIGFKNHISALQEQARDKKNSRRSEYQALLTWCLEAASGFYLTLLHELCNVFDIDLPFRRRGNVYGDTNPTFELNLPQSSSCVYICQYCLVHLGDIARYRNQRKQAENFYKQAILVSPTSGHPYNQLALLEASQGNKLSTVFYYIRGIAVKNPFPASTTNLLSTLSSAIDKESPLDKVHTKITSNEFIQIFLSTHALLHTGTDLSQAELGVKSLNTTMTALVATQSFTKEKLIKITAINLYALKHLNGELTEDEKVIRQYILELLAGSLSAFLIPVHTLKMDESLIDYYALPAVKLLTYWIKNEPNVLQEVVFTNRLQIWPSLCKLLNNVQIYTKDFDFSKYGNSPLAEDRMLQGFTPLQKTFKELNFKSEEVDEKTEKILRIKRLLDFGSFIANIDTNNLKLVTINEDEEKKVFEPVCIQPDPTNDLIEAMKSLTIETISPIRKSLEKRVGILKPQGSLEKSREERELISSGEQSLVSDLSNSSSTSISIKKDLKNKRSKQNIAMQSIFKKLEENKQVKFNVDDPIKDKEKQIPFEAPPLLPTPPSFAPPLRTQSFNQNHPAFPTPPPPQPDYLNTLRNVTKPPPPSFPYPPPDFLPSQSNQSLYNFNSKMAYAQRPPPPPPPFSQFGTAAFKTTEEWWAGNFAFGGYPPQQSNQPGGDVFGGNWGFDGGMSLRQAMLKESGGAGRGNSESFAQSQQQNPGYSLFNTNTWNPNLMGQIRSVKNQENAGPMQQHSLFTGQGPQSLAQLLEQQQNQKNDL